MRLPIHARAERPVAGPEEPGGPRPTAEEVGRLAELCMGLRRQHGARAASERREALTEEDETRRSRPLAGESAEGKGEP